MDVKSPYSEGGCLAKVNPFKRRRVDDSSYTDADLAAELNALSVKERQAMEEDIHGVSTAIPETPEFVDSKVKELHEAIRIAPQKQREAWEYAVYLRPALALDRDLALLFLRSRRFQASLAAKTLLIFYQNKRDLFGDGLLTHRITWDDLSEDEKEIVRSGVYRLIPNQERAGRGISFCHISQWDVHNPKATNRAFFYIHTRISDYPDMQKNGVVLVADLRGTWKSPPLKVLQFVSDVTTVTENLPRHLASTHILYNDSGLAHFIDGVRSFEPTNSRMRYRVHFGSALEIDYALRTFGIQLGDCLEIGIRAGSLSTTSVEQDIQQRQNMDEEWLQAERPYRQSDSEIALFPNPTDVLVGRNKFCHMWSGNLFYRKMIEQQASRYARVENDSSSFEKTVIVMEIMQVMQQQYAARFLTRQDRDWRLIEYAEIRKKISQALRIQSKRFVPE